MTTTTMPSEVEAYLAAVRAALTDLPTAERDDLLAEVEASLVESMGDDSGPIAARLGPPEEFAAELRDAAGLHERESAPRSPSPLSQLLERAAVWVAQDERALRLRRLAYELAPIWWVVRGYVAVGFVAYVLDVSWSTAYPFVPHLFGNGGGGLIAILGAVACSIWLGLRTRNRRGAFRRLLAVANAALVIACIPVGAQLADTSQSDMLVSLAYAPPPVLPDGLVRDGTPILNVYPYSRDGELLHDVLLYDNFGQPLNVLGEGDPFRRYLETPAGLRLLNSFPIRYVDPETKTVTRPDAAPSIDVPEIVTPPITSATPR